MSLKHLELFTAIVKARLSNDDSSMVKLPFLQKVTICIDDKIYFKLPLESNRLGGIAVVGNHIMITYQDSNKLWVFSHCGTQRGSPQALEQLEKPSDMSALRYGKSMPEWNILVISDLKSKLHVYTFDRDLTIISQKRKLISLQYRPTHVSPGFPSGLIVADDVGSVHVLDANWMETLSIPLPERTPSLAPVSSALQTGGGYVILYSGGGGLVCWYDKRGQETHSYDGYSDPLNAPQHMVAEFGGRLLLADTFNKRIRLLSNDGQLLERALPFLVRPSLRACTVFG